VVRTLWGELAWQLGGKQAFTRIQADAALGRGGDLPLSRWAALLVLNPTFMQIGLHPRR